MLIILAAGLGAALPVDTKADVCQPLQRVKLVAQDGAESDFFGRPVASDGDYVLVGVPWDDDRGSGSGAAYLFDINTGQQLLKLVPDDGETYDLFGYSVAIQGDTALIGSYWDDDNGERAGSAYLFDLTTGALLHKLLAEDGAAFDSFGITVALTGDLALVSSYHDDDNGEDSGSVYVFDVNSGTQLYKLYPDDPQVGQSFGGPVAAENNIAVFGAVGDDTNGTMSGAVYVFDLNTGEQINKIVPDDGMENQLFGARVDIHNGKIVIGSKFDSYYGEWSGSAYIYEALTGVQIAKLLPDDGAAHDWFGAAVAINKDIAIVGAEWDDDSGTDSGSVYVFDSYTGTQLLKFTPADGVAESYFGGALDLNGNTALIGAYGDDDNGIASGSVYVFDINCLDIVCDGDLDNDGDTDQADLGILLSAYGDSHDDTGDLDGDGDTDQADLGLLLADYGCVAYNHIP